MTELTVETFNENNRTKRIGCSMYRIAADYTRPPQAPTLWHIYECYNNTSTGAFAKGTGCFTTNLDKVIAVFNSITEEREVIDGKIQNI